MVCFVIFYVHMTLSVLRHVLKEDFVDKETMAGSICIYLLFGMIWAMMYAFVEQMSPGSFIQPFHEGALVEEGGTPHFTVFLYFSFTTLTTLGYGDILPYTDAARSLTSLESITGVLYIGAFVACLISGYRPHSVDNQ
jgi:voltage-gated potassium channel